MSRNKCVGRSDRIRRILIALLMLAWAGCGKESDSLPKASIEAVGPAFEGGFSSREQRDHEPVTLVSTSQDFQSPARSQDEFYPEVKIKTSLGDIHVRLNAERSPRTVDNFLYNYMEDGYYDQTIFHYVESGYLIAAGGYTADLRQKPPRTPIPCEANNGLSNKRGTIAMARDPSFVNSATSQFFINLVDNYSLDYQPSDDQSANGYCVFGEVMAGMDVVDKIAAMSVHDRGDFANTPVEPVIIVSMTRVK